MKEVHEMKKKRLFSTLLVSIIFATMGVSSFADTETSNIIPASQGELSILEESLDPQNYGGIYFDNHQLKIAVKESVPPEAIIATFSNTDLKPDIVRVVYSMNELLNAHDIIEKSLTKIGANAVGINTAENAITLYVNDANTYDISLVKSISPVKNIILREMNSFSFLEPSETDAKRNTDVRATGVVGGNWISRGYNGNRWSTLATMEVMQS